MRVPGMLHAALRLTDHARADVRAHRRRPRPRRRRAWSAVFTAADVPGELRVGIIHKDWPVIIPVGGRTSYAGDVLAVVVAETRQQARDAAALVDGRLRRAAGRSPTPSPPSTIPRSRCGAPTRNVLSRSEYARGDVDAALAASAHVVHEVFQTQRIEHAFLEPEATLAVPGLDDDGRRHLHVYSGGQGVWDDRNQIASRPRCRRATRSPSSSSPTAAPSAARRTWPTRPRPRWRPGSSTGR